MKEDETDGHGTNLGEVRNAYNILLRQPVRKIQKWRCEESITVDLR
jgi:hypothetical protein